MLRPGYEEEPDPHFLADINTGKKLTVIKITNSFHLVFNCIDAVNTIQINAIQNRPILILDKSQQIHFQTK
jgi:hypothetical protein